MQNHNQIKLITVPRILNSPIRPVRAISNLLALTPKGPNLPLFQVKYNQEWVPLTDTRVRRHFAQVLSRLNLAGAGYTFHIFRRSGATFVFNNNVALQNIQKHGTWMSDCVWRYITDSANAGEQVAIMFRDKLSNPRIYLYCWGLAGVISLFHLKSPCLQFKYLLKLVLYWYMATYIMYYYTFSSNLLGCFKLLWLRSPQTVISLR